ncbi:DUF3098 domain-containing protein [Compostibacter hankyongensis]|uniref:DUF3098 domain-containing protein n=1 Tax=Compostibacter hankyongensis TaxID=1007089 RepID=A0ABP8FG46_9BACT
MANTTDRIHKKGGSASQKSLSTSQRTLFLFGRENFIIMLAGLAVLVIGYLLMVGGGSPDPTKFDAKEVYSFRRITLAPIVLVLGLLIEIYAIMKKPRQGEPGEGSQQQ